MTIHSVICKMKPYIQPFEKVLALAELSSLAKVTIDNKVHDVIKGSHVQIDTYVPTDILKKRLTYWETVCDDRFEFTLQVLREATANVSKNGHPLFNIDSENTSQKNIQIPVRRCLRYGPHGIHEYRGKFFPQLVRSLANIADIRYGEFILDPMCGSGTTAVEAILLGCNAIGIDMNPLSILLSKTKCDIIKTDPDLIFIEYKMLKDRINGSRCKPKSIHHEWIAKLPHKDRDYLISWFPSKVLSDIDGIISLISKIEASSIRNLFILSLSNILRKISYQKTDDLRIRKEIYDNKIDAYSLYFSEIERSLKIVLPFLYHETQRYDTESIIMEGDARKTSQYLSDYIGKIKAIITSPPYATALPYIDTDRLSLCFLGILPRSMIRKIDFEMIGNREITEKLRGNYWDRHRIQGNVLPQEILRVINIIYELNKKSNVGFRRKNLPSLLSKYFFDMRDVLIEIKKMLAPKAPAYIVIGNNHTIAGGQKVEIKTHQLLGQLGESVGLTLEDMIPMDMLVSRDIFKKNAVASETILCFRNT